MAEVTMERILKWKILPRLMMLGMSLSAWRVVEWFMTLEDPTPAQAGLVSVVTGAMTGAFAVWLGHEKDGGNGTNVRRVGRPDPDN